jgi:hypothetical protein
MEATMLKRLGSHRFTAALVLVFAFAGGGEAYAQCPYGVPQCFDEGVGTMCAQYCYSFAVESVQYDPWCSTGFCKEVECFWFAFVQEIGGDCVFCKYDYHAYCAAWA